MIGTTVGPYQIEAIVGRSHTDDLLVATDENGMPMLLQRFRMPISYEAYARDLRWTRNVVTKIEHDGIVPIAAVETLPGEQLLFRLRYSEGLTLRAHLSQMRDEKKAYSEEEALAFTRRLALALMPALRMGMVHRYLQPHNILVRPDGAPAVLGLDMPATLAKKLIAASEDEFLQYLSPEQRLGLLLDGRSNIYSLGILLYEMLSMSASDFTWSAQGEALPPLKEVQPDLDASTYRLVDKCLQPESWARYQTYDELLAALGAGAAASTAAMPAFSPEAVQSRRPARARKRATTLSPWWQGRRAGTAMALLALLVIVVFAGFAWGQSNKAGLTASIEPIRRMAENEPEGNLTPTLTRTPDTEVTPRANQTQAPVIVTLRATDSANNIAAGATATSTEMPTGTAANTPTAAPPSPTPSPTTIPPTATDEPVIVPPTATPVPTDTATSPPPPPPTATATSPPPPPPPQPTSTATSPPPPPPPPEPTSTATSPPPPPTATPPPPVPPSPTATSVTAPEPSPTPTATPPIVADYEW